MSDTSNDSALGFTDEFPEDSAHICLVFENEKERKKIVSQFLAAGLKRGERVRYLTDTTPTEDVRKWLLDMGVEVPDAEAKGSFGVMEASKFYFATGRFDPEERVNAMLPQYDVARQAGFTGMRSCGEMSWALKGFPGCERLLEYESRLTAIRTDFPHFGMCQYDARLFDGATLFKILQVHPFMVAREQIVQNPFYVKPQEFVATS